MVRMAIRERWVTLNLVGIIAGLIIFVSILLPWLTISVNIVSPIFAFKWEISPVGILNLISTLQSIVAGIPNPPPLLQQIIALLQAKMALYSAVTLIAIVLLVVGGVVTFFHGFVGGGLSLIGMILFAILAGDLFTSYNLRLPLFSFELGPGLGFILAWAAGILALVSQLFRLKAPSLVSLTFWRGRAYYGVTAPPFTHGYFPTTFLRCPRCGLDNSPGAVFCRNCGTKLTT
jgi:hypothetical protein